MICNKNTTADSQLSEVSPLHSLPECVNNLQSLVNVVRVKIGLIVLYKDRDSTYLDGFVSKLRAKDYIIDILVSIYVLK
jgi:hypothetical protein